MKRLSIFVLLSGALLIAAKSEPSFGGSQQSRLVKISDDVPGDNPLVFCDDHLDYILDIDYVNLKPNPPEPGKNLSVEAAGTLSKDVDTGAKLFLTIQYNSVPILKQEFDLCNLLPSVNLSCPLKNGSFSIAKEVEITNLVPQGKYVVTADVYTEGHKEVITCMEGTAVFT